MNFICGINPVLEALVAGTRHFDRLLIVKGIRNQRVAEAISRASQMSVPLRFETREALDRMAGGVSHQGVIAVVSEKALIDLDTLLAQANQPALVVVLDGLEDPRNLGAVLRTAEAAGADGVVLPERHSAGLSETVSRASAGGLEHVRVARVGNVTQAIETLKARGLWIVGFDAAGTERWDSVDYKRPLGLVLGGEGKGIRRLVREHCDHLVSLPMFGHVGSLNVSVAAGIALYEVIRQRGAVPSLVRPIPLRAAGEARSDVAFGTDEGEDESAVTLRFLPDEEPHWSGSGPTVLKSVSRERHSGGPVRAHGRGGERHGRPRGGPGRSGPGSRSDSGPGAAPSPQQPGGKSRDGDQPSPAGRDGTFPPGDDAHRTRGPDGPDSRNEQQPPDDNGGTAGPGSKTRGRRRRGRSGPRPSQPPTAATPQQAAPAESGVGEKAQGSGRRHRRHRRRRPGPGEPTR